MAQLEITQEQLEKLVYLLTDEQYVAISVLKDNLFNGANWGKLTVYKEVEK